MNLQLILNPDPDLKVLFWYHNFELAESRDALYSAGGAAIYHDPTGAAGTDVGQELNVLAILKMTPRSDLWLGYSAFWGSDVFGHANIQGGAAGLGGNGATVTDADFFYCQWHQRF